MRLECSKLRALFPGGLFKQFIIAREERGSIRGRPSLLMDVVLSPLAKNSTISIICLYFVPCCGIILNHLTYRAVREISYDRDKAGRSKYLEPLNV